jgi:hypothetical protein
MSFFAEALGIGFFEKSDQPEPIAVQTPPPAPPGEEDAATKAAAEAEAAKLRRRKGAKSTIATGPGGIEEQAPVLKKALGE